HVGTVSLHSSKGYPSFWTNINLLNNVVTFLNRFGPLHDIDLGFANITTCCHVGETILAKQTLNDKHHVLTLHILFTSGLDENSLLFNSFVPQEIRLYDVHLDEIVYLLRGSCYYLEYLADIFILLNRGVYMKKGNMGINRLTIKGEGRAGRLCYLTIPVMHSHQFEPLLTWYTIQFWLKT
ncbi:hypothetical protein ACJX0J_030411, partial [Zea mays]